MLADLFSIFIIVTIAVGYLNVFSFVSSGFVGRLLRCTTCSSFWSMMLYLGIASISEGFEYIFQYVLLCIVLAILSPLVSESINIIIEKAMILITRSDKEVGSDNVTEQEEKPKKINKNIL